MKIAGYVVMGATVATLVACATEGGEQSMKADPAADLAAIVAVRDTYASAFKAGDAATIAAFFAADAYDMENNAPTAVGPEGVSAVLTATYAQMTATLFEIRPEKTDISGDMAYDRGTFKLAFTPKAGGAAIADSGRYLVVLKRQGDGQWKLVESMGNSATPVQAPAKN